MKQPRPHIAITGGNFAGLTAALKLSKRHDVTVIDPSTHFEWMPNIHEILSSVKTPHGLRLDRAAIVEQAGHRFLQDRVTELHPAARRLRTAGGDELCFDACIVAVGALWNTHGIPGVERHALPCRSIADALIMRMSTDVLDSIPADEAIRQGDLRRVIVLVDEKAMPHVNFQRTTATALGRYWRQATPEQQQRLQQEFKLLLIRTYAGALMQVEDQTVQLRPMRIEPGDGVHVIRMPEHYGALSPILHVVPLQLLAYHTACARGTDVDKPRNLAKSVTVE